MVVAQPELPRLSRITLLAAVAACRALEAVGSPAISIKWPNDLMRGQRKIAGILVEQLRSPSGEPLLLIGVGINLSLRPGDLPPELEQLATDAGLDERPDTRNSVLGELVQELDQSLAQLGSPGDQARGREYCSRSWLDRRTVVLEYKGQRQTVEIASLTPSGDLLLRDGRELTGEYVQLISVGSGV
ncbi:MAG: BirA family biotin operon repressor/biotin-[acetyl-CoA-carboxylase] ligase [Pseudohongiellaceae bacterium]|jgi:BirA family biotin operon repressor/biotin-[acetyl-CoA-carboxylase] ligase